MKVSELIELLNQALNEEGDIPIHIYNNEIGILSPADATEIDYQKYSGGIFVITC